MSSQGRSFGALVSYLRGEMGQAALETALYDVKLLFQFVFAGQIIHDMGGLIRILFINLIRASRTGSFKSHIKAA